MRCVSPLSIQLSDNNLFEYFVAIVLRNNGYIAGVPRRLLGGRATRHQVNIIGLDLNTSPFSFNNIIIIKGCFDQLELSDLDIVRNLKATVMDLEQTLPPKRELIRDIAGTDRGDLFHRIYGRDKQRETFTVNYAGGIFVSKTLSKQAWEYANAHGIYVTYLPPILGGKTLPSWFQLLRHHLGQIVDSNANITLPELMRKEKKHPAFKEIIHLLKKRESVLQMKPQQNHDLFTIINAVLNIKDFQPLQKKMQQLVLASMNGYPIVIEHNLAYKDLLEAALVSFSNQSKRAKTLSQRTKYRPLDTIKLCALSNTKTLDPNIACINYMADANSASDSIRHMCGSIFVPMSVLNRGTKRFQLKIPLKNGISLICEVHSSGNKTINSLAE